MKPVYLLKCITCKRSQLLSTKAEDMGHCLPCIERQDKLVQANIAYWDILQKRQEEEAEYYRNKHTFEAAQRLAWEKKDKRNQKIFATGALLFFMGMWYYGMMQ